jgi:pimeloyl-ACP methyl ester carboxylesterase
MLEYKFIPTSFGKVHAVVGGEGKPLLLVHGFGETNSWQTWVKNVDALSMVARVYAVELLGYGESDTPEASLDIADHVQVLRQVLDAEGMARAHFAGLSWGGQVAQEFAVKYPERVEKIVLVDSLFDSSEEGLAHLAKIQAPTLIVWDEDDQLIPAQWAHILAMAIRDSRLEIFTREQRDPEMVQHNGHWAQMTHAAWFNKTVTEFLVDAAMGHHAQRDSMGDMRNDTSE